jgi:hypothetical protein
MKSLTNSENLYQRSGVIAATIPDDMVKKSSELLSERDLEKSGGASQRALYITRAENSG